MKPTIFDIETGPIDYAELAERARIRTKNIEDQDEREKLVAEVIAQAPLRAETGHVVAIGYLCGDTVLLDGVEDGKAEADVICKFWEVVAKVQSSYSLLIGFNIIGFDLDFLVKRSWYLGVDFQRNILPNKYGKWDDCFVDLMKFWSLGQYKSGISLDLLCRCLGVEGKNGSGREFAHLWEVDRPRAKEYLSNDLRMTRDVALRLGFDLS